jgi:hypothetical protein
MTTSSLLADVVILTPNDEKGLPERETEFRYVNQSEFIFQILESDVS